MDCQFLYKEFSRQTFPVAFTYKNIHKLRQLYSDDEILLILLRNTITLITLDTSCHKEEKIICNRDELFSFLRQKSTYNTWDDFDETNPDAVSLPELIKEINITEQNINFINRIIHSKSCIYCLAKCRKILKHKGFILQQLNNPCLSKYENYCMENNIPSVFRGNQGARRLGEHMFTNI